MEMSSINLQWGSFLRYCAQYAKRGIVTELDCGVAVYWTQVLWAYTNAFFVSNTVTDESDLLRRLNAINNHVIRTRPSFPWVLFLDPERLPLAMRERSKEICFEAGFVRGMDLVSMQAMDLLPPVHPLPTVEIKFATSEQDLYDAMLLIGEVYDKETSLAKDTIEQHVFISDFNQQFCCIIDVDNKPVSTATTFLLDECLYVTLVATSAQHRKVCSSDLLICSYSLSCSVAMRKLLCAPLFNVHNEHYHK